MRHRGARPDASPGRRPDRVDAALVEVPRTGFLPADQLPLAGEDRPLPIGRGQTSSQPSTVAAMLRLLDVPVGARVLDVGAGSGWTTALLAHLVGPGGEVRGVELEPDLAAWGAANVAAARRPWATLVLAEPSTLGLPDGAPYDRVLVSAEAPRDVPAPLVEQLAVGGRMVLPVRGSLLLVERQGPAADDVEVTDHGAYRFVPLR